MDFKRGMKIGEWIAFAVLALLVGALVYDCSRDGFGL
jgi:hypothetical protein